MLILLLICIVTVHRCITTHLKAMFLSEPLPAATLQQLSATREAMKTLRDFEAEGNTQSEMQAIYATTVDACIVSLVKAIQALSEHALTVGP